MNTPRPIRPIFLGASIVAVLALNACGSQQHAASAHAHAHHASTSQDVPQATAAGASTEEKVDRELSEEEARAIFQHTMERMEAAGALSDMSEADWSALSTRFESEAAGARNDAELRAVMNEMIASLGKSHFAIIPQSATEMPSTSSGGAGTLGLQARFQGDEAIITQVRPGSSADEAGIRPGWLLKSTDGFELASFSRRFGDIESASMPGYHRNAALAEMLTTSPGNELTLELTDLEGEDHELAIEGRPDTAQMIKFGNLPPMKVETTSSILGQEELKAYGLDVAPDYRVGMIQFSVWMVPIMQPILRAIDEFRTEEVDAVIIDLRGNPGGVGGLAMGVGGHFFKEPVSLGTMYNDFGEMHFNTNPQRISSEGKLVEPLSTPLAILIDEMSASTSEIFAGGMQSAERATIVGRRTPGMALPAVAEELPNGDILYHAIAEFELPDGRTIEGLGVAPDAIVPLEPTAFATSCDPDVRTAVELMTQDDATPPTNEDD
jgi:carboxyl-terminal processing protease